MNALDRHSERLARIGVALAAVAAVTAIWAVSLELAAVGSLPQGQMEVGLHQRYHYAGAALATLFVALFVGGLIAVQARQKRARQELEVKNTVLTTQQETSPDAILLVDENARIVSHNRRFLELWGIPEELARAGDDEPVLSRVVDQVRNPEGFLARVRYLYEHRDERSNDELHTRDGRTIDRYSAPVIGPDGTYHGRVWYFHDVTQRWLAEEQLRLSANAFTSIADGVIVTDADLRIVSVNEAFSTICGYTREEVLGKTPKLLHSGRHDADFYSAMWGEIDRTGRWKGEVWDRRKNGEVYPELLSISAVKDGSGAIGHYVGVFTDLSSLKRYEQRLHHQAHHDALTGLPNRVLFRERFCSTLRRARRRELQGAVLFLDLDRFKQINDSLGHAVGDLLLREVARRLTAGLREVDTVARFGGDEFAVLLDAIGDPRAAAAIARKLLDEIARPFEIGGHQLYVSATVGISCFPQDGIDSETLLKNADTAMYRAKAEGCNNYKFYSAEMSARALDDLLLSNQLRLAPASDQLLLHYQPQSDLATGRITGVEALLRWQHPERGLLLPDRFVPLAEETGLVEAVGAWVLASACAQMQAWRQAGLPLDRVAVNLSACQFRHPDLAQHIAAVLAESGLPARHLELEVTESTVMQDPEGAAKVLSRLKEMGITIAVDDFGTGYSSLSYLKRFPIDYLKIDRSFVRGVPDNADDVAIVKAIIAMAKSLNLKLIAEGVETDEQRAFLFRHGCDEAQGFHFGRPVPAEELASTLEPPARSLRLPLRMARSSSRRRPQGRVHLLDPVAP